MSESNNVPQEARQQSRSGGRTANTNFEREYEMARQEMNGAGTQSSLKSPANIEPAEASGGTAETGGTSAPATSERPGDPADFVEIAESIDTDQQA